MQTTNYSSRQEQELRDVITRFLQDLHETAGPSVRHVTVSVHGEASYLSPDREINAISVNKMQGVSTLSYQEIPVEAPIANIITLIVTDNEAAPA